MRDAGSPVLVVGVMSSARLNGNTATLVRAALSAAAEAGAQTAEVELPKHRLGYCKGCLRCMAEGRCVAADDFEEIRKLLSEADGIILSSPTYGSAPCAMMKNLIDRFGLFEYFTSSAFGGKYLAGISTANSAGAAKKVARNLAFQFAPGIFQKGHVSGFFGAASRGNGLAKNGKAVGEARQLGKKLVQDIRAGSKYPLQSPMSGLLNRFILKPSFSTAILDNREGVMKGVYENLNQRRLL